METFTLNAAARTDEKRLWDSATGQWQTRKRITENPPQNLTAAQRHYLKERHALLADRIRLETFLKRQRDQRKSEGPIDFVYFHFKLLEPLGFADVETETAYKQLAQYAWDLVERYVSNRLTWDEFEDQVESWFLAVADKLERRRIPKAVAK